MLRNLRRLGRAGLLLTIVLTLDAGAQTTAAGRRLAIEGMYPVMLRALEAGNYGRARNICEQAILWEPQNPVHHYNLACIEAQAGGPRLPYAWGALQLAVALGFDDVNHLQSDPDLLPLRADPRFSEMVEKMIAPAAELTTPPPVDLLASPAPAAGAANRGAVGTESPAGGLPEGFFLMARYHPTTRTLERSVWYFAPDKAVYRDLQAGCSNSDLAAHTGPRGQISVPNSPLTIIWRDGTETSGTYERDRDGFVWDMGIFTRVHAFENAREAAGVYETTFDAGDDAPIPVAQVLELREDGTFHWGGVAFTRRKKGGVRLAAAPEAATDGRWKLDGWSLVLVSTEGYVVRRLGFPDDDEKTVIRPDRMYFAGSLYKRRP